MECPKCKTIKMYKVEEPENVSLHDAVNLLLDYGYICKDVIDSILGKYPTEEIEQELKRLEKHDYDRIKKGERLEYKRPSYRINGQWY
jgi:hypothetical protein